MAEVLLPLRRWQALQYQPNQWALENVHTRNERFIIGTTCRQVGKTETAAMMIDEGMNAPVDDYGDTPVVGVVGPTFDKAELSVNKYIERLVKTFGPDCYKVNQNKHILTITDPKAGTVGARLVWMSCDDPQSVVGLTLSRVIMDECQNIPDEVWSKLRPTLDVKDARAFCFGTPDVNSTQSWFRGMWLRGQDEDTNNAHSYTVSCYENPWMSTESILEAKAQLTDREFRMLYLGQWVDTEGSVFPHPEQGVLSDVSNDHDPHKRYAMSIDLAVYDDFNVVMIQEEATRILVHYERWHQTDPLVTEDRIVSIWEKWGQPRTTADETGIGIPMVAGLRRRGIHVFGVTIGANNKMEMVGQLASDIEHRKIMYPKWEPLLAELRAFAFKKTPSGRLTASALAGFHDDMVMCMVLLNNFTRRSIGSHDRPRNYMSNRESSLTEMLRGLNG